MKTTILIACTSLFATLAPACSSSEGSGDASHDAVEEALCRDVTCSGHGACHASSVGFDDDMNMIREPNCFCDEGFLDDKDDPRVCIPRTARNEGRGYRFEREPSAEVVARELEGLRGDWFLPRFWYPVPGTGEVEAGGVHFAADASGLAWWRADSVDAATAGHVRLSPPETQVVQIGTMLTGAFDGFRPLQFSTTPHPEEAKSTLLYKRSEEANRPVLLLVICSDWFTSGTAKPPISKCVEQRVSPSNGTTYVREMPQH